MSALSSLKLFQPDAVQPDNAEPAAPPAITLEDFFSNTYCQTRPQLRSGTVTDYHLEIRKFSRWLSGEMRVDPPYQTRQNPRDESRVATLADCNDDTLTRYIAALLVTKDPPQSEATVKKARNTILAMWRMAWLKKKVDEFPRDVPEVSVPKRRPQAWRPEEMDKLLAACARREPYQARGRAWLSDGEWDARHWTALVLTLYDTSLRVNAALQVPLVNLNLQTGMLLTSAAQQKHGNDELQQLHAETLEAIAKMLATRRWAKAGKPAPKGELLFACPFKSMTLWRHFTAILVDAGLPAGRRDKFHKIRRTTYTYTNALLGRDAATQQAGHSADLSRFYLDTALSNEIAGKPVPTSVLPRPKPPKFDGKQLELF